MNKNKEIIYNSDFLKVTRTSSIIKDKYKIDFCGHISYLITSEQGIQDTIDKRVRAYNLIPKGAVIVNKDMIKLFQGNLMCGILEDSVVRVIGIIHGSGIPAYSCSIFYIPTKEELQQIIVNEDNLKIHIIDREYKFKRK